MRKELSIYAQYGQSKYRYIISLGHIKDACDIYPNNKADQLSILRNWSQLSGVRSTPWKQPISEIISLRDRYLELLEGLPEGYKRLLGWWEVSNDVFSNPNRNNQNRWSREYLRIDSYLYWQMILLLYQLNRF